jgi:hypothetical protein
MCVKNPVLRDNMELTQNIRLVLERQRIAAAAATASTIKPTVTYTPTQQGKHLFNTMEEYSVLKKAKRFEPSWALIGIQQARERGVGTGGL